MSRDNTVITNNENKSNNFEDMRNKQIDYKISKESVDRVFSEPKIDVLGYEPPINIFVGNMVTNLENKVVEVVRGYDISVDKAELEKALRYDRDQYNKGYINGYKDARTCGNDDVVEVVRCRDCKYYKPQTRSITWNNTTKCCCRCATVKENENDYCSYGERSKNDNT